MLKGATMFRQSPSRNQRSKGFKVKHGLQIFLLLAVCLWLLYQVKHSHDKKKAFDESTSELTEKFGNRQEILKLGRKDLHPQVEETTVGNERHSEEEEVEENKHEEEVEEEEEESKPEESGEEGRGGGDDEIDEQDQEREDEDADRKEDFIDEEDKENEEKENEREETDSSDDQDHDRNTQEAREENYKGDDASSAVARDSQISNTEAGSGESSNGIEDDKNQLEPKNGSNSTKEATSNPNDSNQNTSGVGKNIEGEKPLNVTAGEAAPKTKLYESADESQSNSTLSTESNNQSEVKNNSTAEIAQAPTLPLLNGTNMNSVQAQDHYQKMETSTGGNSNLKTVVQELPEKNNTTTGVEQSGYNASNENADATKTGATNSSSNFEEQPVASNATAREEKQSGSSSTNENEDGAVSEKSNDPNTGTREGDDGNGDAALNLSNDSRDSMILEEESESRTDLGTLPETQNEAMDNEDAAAE